MMSLFSASRISSRGLIPTATGGAGGGVVAGGAAITGPAGTRPGPGTGVRSVGATDGVSRPLAGIDSPAAEAAAAAGMADCCFASGSCLGGGGGGCNGSGAGADALDVAAARAILSADFLASPGVGTGVEQVSAALPQLLAGGAVQSAAVVRRIRNGGTGHWSGGAAAAAAGAGAVVACSSRRGGATGAGPGGGCRAEVAVRDGGGIDHGADAIRLAVSESRPLGV